MQAFQETTKWEDPKQPNHIYLMESDRAYAYLRAGSKIPFYFSKPMQISKRGRKFVPLFVMPFDLTKFDVEAKEPVPSNLIEVSGSKGNVYYVDPVAKTCTCPGFTFRGKCKHTAELK